MLERIRAGTIAGLAAGISVAVMVLVYDLVRLDPLSTPRLLAGSILGAPAQVDGGAGALEWVESALRVGWGLLFYTATHLTVFALVGILAAWVFGDGLLRPNVVTGALYGLVAGTAVFYAGIALVAPGFISAPDWRLVLVMNAVAGVVLASQLVGDPAGDAAEA